MACIDPMCDLEPPVHSMSMAALYASHGARPLCKCNDTWCMPAPCAGVVGLLYLLAITFSIQDPTTLLDSSNATGGTAIVVQVRSACQPGPWLPDSGCLAYLQSGTHDTASACTCLLSHGRRERQLCAHLSPKQQLPACCWWYKDTWLLLSCRLCMMLSQRGWGRLPLGLLLGSWLSPWWRR
jgi:hypothetical protein